MGPYETTLRFTLVSERILVDPEERPVKKRVWILLFVALGGLASGGCGTRLREYRCVVAAETPSVDVDAIWSCNRRIIVHAIKGRGFSLREFRQAAAFFERVTGIPADVRPSEQGILPGPDLERSLGAWDAWLADHPGQLEWDAERRAVVVGAAGG